MANWKKVIVSGSQAELNTLFTSAHITSSGIISASGRLFGGLQSGTHDEVIIYDTATGELKYKLLNLISTVEAPALFAADFISTTDNNTHFKLSHAPGNTSLISSNIYPYIQLSASINSGGTIKIYESASTTNYIGLNEEWSDIDIPDSEYYNPPTDITSSIIDARDGLDVGATAAVDRAFTLQSINSLTDYTAVPGYPSTTLYENYGNRAFKDGGIGKLEFYVNNNVTPIRSFDLETNLDAVSANDDGNIIITLFATQSNVDDTTGSPDPSKHYRSGSFTVKAATQRDGYNYCYVVHTGSKDGTEFAYVTNFAEWFYDFAGAQGTAGGPMTTTDQGVISNPSFDMTATSSISGIKFFNTSQDGANIKYGARIENQYKNVYPTSNGIQMINVTGDTVSSISITQSGQFQVLTENSNAVGTGNTATSTFNLADLTDTAGANTTDTRITASINIGFTPEGILFYQPTSFINSFTSDAIENANNIISFTPKFTHISGHKTDLTLNQVSFGDYMLNQLSDNATINDFEDFKGETYRLISRSYASTDTIDSTTYAWDSEMNVVNGGAGYDKGNIQYYSHLLYPTGAGVGGTFDVELGPTGSGVQPTNYNTATGEREYYRYFKLNSSQAGQKTFNIELLGTGKIVSETHTSHFGAGDNDAIKVYIWRSVGGSNSLFDGSFINVMDTSVYQGNTITNINTQYIPLSTSGVSYSFVETVGGITFRRGVARVSDAASSNITSENEFVIIKIVTPQNWTGNIEAMALTLGSTVTDSGKLIGSTYTSL